MIFYSKDEKVLGFTLVDLYLFILLSHSNHLIKDYQIVIGTTRILTSPGGGTPYCLA